MSRVWPASSARRGAPIPLLAVVACGGLEYYDPNKPDVGTSVDGTTPDPDDTTPGGDTGGPSPTDTDPTPTGTTPTGTTPTGTTPTGTTTTEPFVLGLTGVVPHYGPTGGGTRVVATGSFDAATTLTFGGVPGTVVSSTPTELTVDTPPGATGWVDVQATSGAQAVPLPHAYQYWADGAGQTGAFGWVGYLEVVGGFWTGNPPDTAFGLLGFSQPGSWELWQDYTPVLDTCQFDYAGIAQPTPYDPGAASVTLRSGAVTATVPADPTVAPGVFADGALVPGGEVVPGSLYDLDPVAGNADWPGFGVTGFVEVPPAFDVTAPNLDRPNDPINVLRSFTVTWDGGGGDYVLIWILRQYLVGANWVNDGVVTCAVSDTGSFTIPGNTWPDWYVDDFLHIQVGRVMETRAVLPHDGSEALAAGIYWYYGGAETSR